MIKRFLPCSAAAAPGVLASCLWMSHSPMFAQDVSFSPSLATPIVQSTSTSGFNAVFDPSSSSLTNGELHTDISDPTHSQLLGSVLSPANIPAVNGNVDSLPQTGILSDAQLAAQYGAGGFAIRRDSAFAARATSNGFGGAGEAQSFRGNGYGGVNTRMAFTGTGVTPNSLASPASSFSGATATSYGGNATSYDLDPRLRSSQRVDALGTSTTLTLAVDPVLTGALSGMDAGTQVQDEIPKPSTQTSQFFSSSAPVRANFAYEDGQTPPSWVDQTPGVVLGAAPYYGVASSGFPDSTRGLAGLAPESDALVSPLERADTGVSPLASSIAAGGGGLRQRLNPNLHASPAPFPPQSFEAFERKAQDQRLVSGLSISQSSMVYQKDLRDYQRRGQRRSSRSLSQSNALLNGGRQQEMIPKMGR